MQILYPLYIAAGFLMLATFYTVYAVGASSRAERFGRIIQLILLCAIVALTSYYGLSEYNEQLGYAARV